MAASPGSGRSSTSQEGRLAGRHIVLGVSGGIAAYKAAHLARLLVMEGASVQAVLTRAATELIGPATFSGLTGRRARTDLWDEVETVPHIRFAREADGIVIAPATAHLVAKAATGLADDLLTNILLMARCPVLLAPAMHTEMWEHPATQANIATLAARGIERVGPAEGELAGGDVGEGRMVEPPEILDSLVTLLARSGAMAGLRVIVTAGPTREHIDPVRFLTNRSSGRMGYALAAEAARRGAEVHLVSGPVSLTNPPGVERHRVTTALEMRDTVRKLAEDADVVVKAAAVADFRPESSSARKLKKAEGVPAVELVGNPDILAELGHEREGDRPVLVGFAAETDDAERYGRRKLEEKRVDLMVVNDVSAEDAGFEVETNRAVVLTREGERVDIPLATKPEVASRVWDVIVDRLG